MLHWLADEQYGEMGGLRERKGREWQQEEEASEDEDIDDLDKHVLHDVFSPPPPPLSVHPRAFRHVASPPTLHCHHCYTPLLPYPTSSSSSFSG